jgi:hypothetical protein
MENGVGSSNDSPAQLKRDDLVEAVLSTIDDERTPELELLIEAPEASSAQSAHRAEQAGINRTWLNSKLHSLAVPAIRLKEMIHALRDRNSDKRT